MRLGGRIRVRLRGRPAREPHQSGGLRGADAEEAHHLPAGEWTTVPVQFEGMPNTRHWAFEVRYPGPVDHITVKRSGTTEQETRFAEAGRGEQLRGNAGAIPDKQTPGAKSADQLKSEREADESKRKGKAMGGGG